jgi:hypothetical protein
MSKQRNNELPKKVDRLMGLLSKIYAQDGERSLQELLVNAKIRVVEETGYDNWNGGQVGHDIFLSVSEDSFIPFIKNKNDIQTKIRTDLNNINSVPDEYISDVFLEIEDALETDWRRDSGLLITPGKQVTAAAEQRIWKGNAFRVFLSHKTEVKKQTALLKEELSQYGISCFVAHEDIHPTQDWQNEIEGALATADAFIALLTEKFHESLWTDQEVGYALARGIPILAVRLGRDPYGFIGKFQALSCDWTTAPVEIMKILIKHDRMVGAYIEAISRLESFNQANTLASLLPYIEKLGDDGGKALVEAYNNNSEARGGFGFNGSKPTHYGKGLVFHLQRLGISGYSFGEARRITRDP